MKRTGKAVKISEKDCQHEETYPVAAFVDNNAKEAFLLQVCEDCGQNFLLMGQYPLVVC